MKGKPCKLYFAPFNVCLFERKFDSPDNVDTVVRPDIMVICDKDKIDKNGCKGVLEPVEAYSEKDIAKCSVLPELTIDMLTSFPEE